MIKHVVSWKIKEQAEGRSKEENIAIMKQMLLDLRHKLPMVKYLEVGVNSPKADASNWDVVLITDVESIADLQAYQVHPEHVKVGEFVAKVRESRACIDYEF
jgi:hypothetical protein